MSYLNKILTVSEIGGVRSALRDAGEVLVHCHGCFDIVHPGHIRYLRYARAQGSRLLVSLTADAFIDKGYDRPLIPENLRAENLAALEFVDYVIVAPHPTALELIDVVKPDVYIKGKEYEDRPDTRFSAERERVELYGGAVVFSSGDVVFSSTRLADFVRGESEIEHEKIAFFLSRHGLELDTARAFLDGIRGSRFVVMGDPILDRYTHCEELTIASEHPIPSVTPVASSDYAGGGALIAGQLAQLGARAELFTTFDLDDPAAPAFRDLVEASGVALEAFPSDDRPIFVKTRYVVDGQKVFKVNTGRRSPLSTRSVQAALERLRVRLEGAHGLIVTDFGYGLFGSELIDGIQGLGAELGVPIVVDVSGAGTTNLLKFRDVVLSAPTEGELRRALGDYESGISNLCARYHAATRAEHVAVTMGRRGALLMTPPGERGGSMIADYLPALSKHPLDVVGAGDAFLSVFTACMLTGAPAAAGLLLGNLLASCHIARIGNAPTSIERFHTFLAQFFARHASPHDHGPANV